MPHAIPETSVNFSEIIIEPYADLTRIRFIDRNRSQDRRLALEITYNNVHSGIETRVDQL